MLLSSATACARMSARGTSSRQSSASNCLTIKLAKCPSAQLARYARRHQKVKRCCRCCCWGCLSCCWASFASSIQDVKMPAHIVVAVAVFVVVVVVVVHICMILFWQDLPIYASKTRRGGG
ncbi:unnamed protein product, partial [Polarella glacialis]